MAITERVRPYETLIRHNDNGTIGAHHQTISEIVKDGVVISASINSPQGLSVADGQEGLLLSDVIGEAATEALKELELLKAQLQVSNDERAGFEVTISALNQEVATLNDELAQIREVDSTQE